MSNPNVDLETVIEDSLTDAQLPDEVVETPELEATEEPAVEEIVEEPATDEVPAPGSEGEKTEEKVETKTVDEFEKLAGMPAVGALGRENRIPYSRVKKITEKAVSELAEAAVGRKLNPGEKALDVVKAHVAQIPELTSKVTDYESRLDKVGQFEQVMANEPERFLQMLARVPAYKEFFQFVQEAYESREAGGSAGTAAAQQVAASGVTNTETSDAGDPMPEPNDQLEDGTKVYNMEGLKALMAWNSRETERRVDKRWEGRLAEVEGRYRPMEAEFRHRKHVESVLPVIRKQIEEAKTWTLFNENEAEITALLEADPNISLEGAYRKVVFPKLVAERNTVRQQVIKEVQQAPRSTSVTSKQTSPNKNVTAGPRSLEEIIKEQIDTKLK